jgi:PKD repeat protein
MRAQSDRFRFSPARRVRKWLCAMLLASLVPGLAGTVHAAQVTLRWDYAASGAAGFVLYCGPASRSYPIRVDVGNTDAYTIASLPEGATTFCAVTAYDSGKVESDYSKELSFYLAAAMPVVNFSASPASGTAPVSVAFTNTTTGQVTSWSWDFGDGTTSTAKSPTHVYSTPGSYKPVLKATGPGGTTSKTATTAISVVAPAAPVVSFSASPSSGVAPLSVAFNNTTTGQVTSWAWSFGDNTTSIVKSPTHVYSAAGSYTAKLTATGPGGAVSKTMVISVTAQTSDTTAPTVAISAPASGATVSGTTTVSATASDNVKVVGVQFLLDGIAIGAEQPGPAYSISWNAASASNGAHTITARARDAAGNTKLSAARSVTVANALPTGGLVAAYGFNEGSGATAKDDSGNGNTGTIEGASWVAGGRYGKALSFNGVNSMVSIATSASLNLSKAMTLSAWVYPTATQSGRRTIILKEANAYSLYASSSAGPLRPAAGGTVNGQGTYVYGPSPNPVNAWTHLALTYDGATLRFYVNGTQVASQARAGAFQINANVMRIGGTYINSEFFKGLIDEVRIYNRALTQSEIKTAMAKAVGVP